MFHSFWFWITEKFNCIACKHLSIVKSSMQHGQQCVGLCFYTQTSLDLLEIPNKRKWGFTMSLGVSVAVAQDWKRVWKWWRVWMSRRVPQCPAAFSAAPSWPCTPPPSPWSPSWWPGSAPRRPWPLQPRSGWSGRKSQGISPAQKTTCRASLMHAASGMKHKQCSGHRTDAEYLWSPVQAILQLHLHYLIYHHHVVQLLTHFVQWFVLVEVTKRIWVILWLYTLSLSFFLCRQTI